MPAQLGGDRRTSDRFSDRRSQPDRSPQNNGFANEAMPEGQLSCTIYFYLAFLSPASDCEPIRFAAQGLCCLSNSLWHVVHALNYTLSVTDQAMYRRGSPKLTPVCVVQETGTALSAGQTIFLGAASASSVAGPG